MNKINIFSHITLKIPQCAGNAAAPQTSKPFIYVSKSVLSFSNVLLDKEMDFLVFSIFFLSFRHLSPFGQSEKWTAIYDCSPLSLHIGANLILESNFKRMWKNWNDKKNDKKLCYLFKTVIFDTES